MTMLSEFRNKEPKRVDVEIHDPSASISLEGVFYIPQYISGFVVFAHGSGSSKSSPRNNKVAKFLAEHKMASLIFDLLTPEEAEDRKNVFDISLLSERLMMATQWLQFQSFYDGGAIAYFGASTGSAAALVAASKFGSAISGVVSRGGRVDLVPNSQMAKVVCPVLLIVGELDEHVLNWNRRTLTNLRHGKLSVINGASHLFEEEGALDRVSNEASLWFQKCFREKELERLTNLQ
jgi:pimeloyl-ACP methyl ester carboxylesterase